MIRTGRVLPGSVPCGGFRSASQISPRLSIRVALDGSERGVGLHTLIAHAFGDFGKTFRAKSRRRFVIHPANRDPNVFGARDAERIGQSSALCHEVFWKLEGDRSHRYLLQISYHSNA